MALPVYVRERICEIIDYYIEQAKPYGLSRETVRKLATIRHKITQGQHLTDIDTNFLQYYIINDIMQTIWQPE